MTKEELLKHSATVRSQADHILKSTNLLNTLKEFGEVFVQGSYPLDLMYGPDIDIIVSTEDIREASLNAYKKLLDLRQFRKFEYGDFVKFPHENRPQGYILVLKTTVEGVKWEIEVWFLTSAESHKEKYEWIRSRLNEENRLKILEAKHERETAGGPKHQLNSLEIYEKIL